MFARMQTKRRQQATDTCPPASDRLSGEPPALPALPALSAVEGVEPISKAKTAGFYGYFLDKDV